MLKKLVKLMTHKASITMFSFLVQVALIVLGVLFASAYLWWIWFVLEFISLCICIYIVSRDMNPSYKLSWCVLILALPAFGGLLYL
ncbi:MAG: PLDc N-terminal domain-containing protein, partial [Clostridiales bacterium]|nr:PLDc N-terminal domain-containing protein [Clostridiales bacterium]